MSVYDEYADNSRDKEVFLQAANLTYSGVGDRHVLIGWSNSDDASGEVVPQLS